MRHRPWYYLLLLFIAGTGVAIFLLLTLSRSQPTRRPHKIVAPTVEVKKAQPTSVPVVVHAMGGVQPARSVKVIPQVAGRVIYTSPQLKPGGWVKKNSILVQIDPKDYELAIRIAQAAVTQAQLSTDVQEGQRAAARRELQLVERGLAPTQKGMRLASRQSHVENALAQLDAAKSRLEQAQLARSRTIIRAPFDARVAEKSADVGLVVTPQSVLAVLIASSTAWVEASLPMEKLRWIDVPGQDGQQGAQVKVRQKLIGATEITRQGKVLGLLPGLHERGKLARLLIEVSDPFGLQSASDTAEHQRELPLLMGSYVHLDIQGHKLAHLFPLPRAALREGERVWIYDAKQQLAIRAVEVVWREGEVIYVRGDLSAGELVVVSHLASAIPGMKLRLASDKRHTKEGPNPTPNKVGLSMPQDAP